MFGFETAVGALGLLLASFVIAELAARKLARARRRYFVWAPYRRVEMRVDPDVLPRLEGTVRFQINREGERADEPPSDWGEACRVLVAGGSAAECYFLDQRRSWPHVVQTILNEPRNRALLGVERVHVGNVARSLVDCACVYRIIERILPRYERLDLAVLMVGASDIVAWLESGAPAEPREQELASAELFAEHPEGPFGWTPRRLALARVAAPLYRRILRPVERLPHTGHALARSRRMRQDAQKLIEQVPEPGPMIDRFDTWLRSLILTLQARGTRVILARQPWFDKDFTPEEESVMWNFALGKPLAGEVEGYYSHQVVRELMRAVDDRAAQVAFESGVEQVDLMAVLDRSLETYYDFLHFTPKGATVVAEAITRVILEPLEAESEVRKLGHAG